MVSVESVVSAGVRAPLAFLNNTSHPGRSGRSLERWSSGCDGGIQSARSADRRLLHERGEILVRYGVGVLRASRIWSACIRLVEYAASQCAHTRIFTVGEVVSRECRDHVPATRPGRLNCGRACCVCGEVSTATAGTTAALLASATSFDAQVFAISPARNRANAQRVRDWCANSRSPLPNQKRQLGSGGSPLRDGVAACASVALACPTSSRHLSIAKGRPVRRMPLHGGGKEPTDFCLRQQTTSEVAKAAGDSGAACADMPLAIEKMPAKLVGPGQGGDARASSLLRLRTWRTARARSCRSDGKGERELVRHHRGHAARFRGPRPARWRTPRVERPSRGRKQRLPSVPGEWPSETLSAKHSMRAPQFSRPGRVAGT